MNDNTEFNALRSTLRQFQPAPLHDDLRRDLEAVASNPQHTTPRSMSFADRVLALWTLSGALAACLVLALTIWQLAESPRPAPSSPHDFAQHQQTMQEFSRLLASR
jgi:hypothetical protein